MKLYVFNPENDLALANNDPHFIPPRSARRMAADMCLLPAWWMGEGDVLWGDARVRDASRRLLDESLGIAPAPVWMDGEPDATLSSVCPWGWSPLLLTALRRVEVPERLLPSLEWMAAYRRLSGRQTAARWLSAFREEQGGQDGFFAAGYCGESVVCHREEDIEACLSKWPETLLKAPWSGSGKGLRLGSGGYVAPLVGWCLRLLATQGAVTVEPLYEKVLDFAMEFHSDGAGNVHYEGLSLFRTSGQGAYAGNLLAPESALRERLVRYVPLASVDRVKEFLLRCLAKEVAGVYEGYCGVDMMVCRVAGRYVLHPCVELNLRMTMGRVAQCLARRLAVGTEGVYRVVYSADSAALQQWAASRLREAPRRMEDGKIVSGYWPLTPVTSDTAYHAYLDVSPVVI